MKLVGQIVLGVAIGILIAYSIIQIPQWRADAAQNHAVRQAVDRDRAVHALTAANVVARCGNPKSDTTVNSTRTLAYADDGQGKKYGSNIDISVGFLPPDGGIAFVSYGSYRSTDEAMWIATLPCLATK